MEAMMVEGISSSPAPAGLIEKVKAILLKPKEEWPKIAADPSTPGDIATRFAIPLIAIGPVASFIGGQVFGYGAFRKFVVFARMGDICTEASVEDEDVFGFELLDFAVFIGLTFFGYKFDSTITSNGQWVFVFWH
jgi:hypothetical protein